VKKKLLARDGLSVRHPLLRWTRLRCRPKCSRLGSGLFSDVKPMEEDRDEELGLPEILRELEREEARIVVRVERRRFRKAVTVIAGLDPKASDIKGIAKALKSSLASGGTVKGTQILLQGDHREQVKRKLIEMGFKPERIDVQ